jgi:hypothetical protein
MQTLLKRCIKSETDMLKNLFKATRFIHIHMTVHLRSVHFEKRLAGQAEGLKVSLEKLF